MILPKIAGRSAGVVAKVGTRAIPVVGWGLLGVDIGADILRWFGVDVTEWLGISPILSIFNPSGNMLESWVAQHSQGAQATQGKPIPYQIADKEAAKANPEAPGIGSNQFQIAGTGVVYQRSGAGAPIPGTDFTYWGQTEEAGAIVSIRPPETYRPEEWLPI